MGSPEDFPRQANSSSSKGQLKRGQELWGVWGDQRGMADKRRKPETLPLSLHR